MVNGFYYTCGIIVAQGGSKLSAKASRKFSKASGLGSP
jgi:hypothetical protein